MVEETEGRTGLVFFLFFVLSCVESVCFAVGKSVEGDEMEREGEISSVVERGLECGYGYGYGERRKGVRWVLYSQP